MPFLEFFANGVFDNLIKHAIEKPNFALRFLVSLASIKQASKNPKLALRFLVSLASIID